MIRAITLGVPYTNFSVHDTEKKLLGFHTLAKSLLEKQHWPLRTTRITLPPLTEQEEKNPNLIPAQLASIGRIAEKCGMRWFCLPIDLLSGETSKSRLKAVLDSLTRESRMFVNLMTADSHHISIEGAAEAATFILKVSKKSNNGFDNFRIGASCNCRPNAPFFPFSRHEGDSFRFSLALETTDIALLLSEKVRFQQMSLADFHTEFVSALKRRLEEIEAFAHELSKLSSIEYFGLDAALAPFPDGSTSVGRLLENLGAAPIGSQGTLFITSLLTDGLRAAITQSKVKTTGFNGVMFSVLEDDYLAKANSQKRLDINALSAYSTMCGCGLDMIPIPGASFAEDISAIILDTAALAVRLQKPLGVRLLPIPNKAINERTEFNLDFLCDSRVMGVEPSDMPIYQKPSKWQYSTPCNTTYTL